jgi:glycosyltransferase involved in cell wall biosynthesis
MGHITLYASERRRMMRLLRSISPDVVHAQGTGMYAGVALDSGYPAVISLQGILFREAALVRNPWRRLQRTMASIYEKRCLRRMRDVIPSSTYAVQEFSQWMDATIHDIENPADDALFDLPMDGEEGRTLYTGRVIPRKNVLWLVQAWKQVVAEMPHARLRVAGEMVTNPAYVQKVREYVATQGLEGNVDFLGNLDRERLLEEYARCRLFVLPSVQETSPVAVVEALSAGRPVVATRVCGVPYLVHERETGVLVDLGDTEGFASAVLQVLGNEALRQQMGARAREDARGRFKIDVVAQRTYEVYRQLANGAAR